jgi:lantibiotic biosynthesis dehydratase-like protein
VSHLALHVFHWGDAPQNRLIAECLVPAARELRADGASRRFWFTRFDTRGPHVFALFTPAAGREAELRRRLARRLDAYLAAHPSTVELSPEEIERRHVECRGKQLSAIDAEPGFAPNNSYAMAPHPGDGYPFRLGAGVADGDALWDAVEALVFWTVEQQRAGTATPGAVRWMAAVDHALHEGGVDPAEFWRHHATTLLVYLRERLDADEEGVLAALPGAVGERNRALFDALWEGDGPERALARPVVEIVLAPDGRSDAARRSLLREINHFTLAQLGQPVKHHIPLVLYAWQRNLRLQPA